MRKSLKRALRRPSRQPAPELPRGDQKTAVVEQMFDSIADRYQLLNKMMTLGVDKRWRLKTLRLMDIKRQATVIDLASGTGDFCHLLDDIQMNSIGVDLSHGMLKIARASNPETFRLLQASAEKLPIASSSVDGITCGFGIRNFTDLAAAMNEMARICRPGARIGVLEAATPQNPVVAFVHNIWLGKAVPILGSLLSSKSAYGYLPKSLAYLPPAEELRNMLEQAGFTNVEHRYFSFGAIQLLTATRK